MSSSGEIPASLYLVRRQDALRAASPHHWSSPHLGCCATIVRRRGGVPSRRTDAGEGIGLNLIPMLLSPTRATRAADSREASVISRWRLRLVRAAGAGVTPGYVPPPP